jgi:hypothetical protein
MAVRDARYRVDRPALRGVGMTCTIPALSAAPKRLQWPIWAILRIAAPGSSAYNFPMKMDEREWRCHQYP